MHQISNSIANRRSTATGDRCFSLGDAIDETRWQSKNREGLEIMKVSRVKHNVMSTKICGKKTGEAMEFERKILYKHDVLRNSANQGAQIHKAAHLFACRRSDIQQPEGKCYVP